MLPLQSPPPRLVSSLQPRSPHPPQSQRRPRPRRGRQLQYPRHPLQRHGSKRWRRSPPPKPTRSKPSSRGSSHRRERPRRHRGARGALHRPRAHRAAAHVARQLCRQPRRDRRLRAGEEGRAVRQARGARSGRRARPTWRRTSPPASRPTPPRSSRCVRTHTIQGTFCDPYYGGNANFVGWDLIGYPGIRLAVTADEQRMKARAKPERVLGLCRRRLRHDRRYEGRRPWPSTLRRPTSSSSGSARSAASPRCRSRARAST